MKNLTIKLASGIILSIIVLIGLFYRHPTPVNYMGQATEFNPLDTNVSISHEVVIKGIYYSSFLGHDSFRGTFFISNVDGVESNENNADFVLNPKYRYCPTFLNSYGEPINSQIAQLLFDKNFCRLAVQFNSKYSRSEEGFLSTETNDTTSSFLVLDVADRETALIQYSAMLKEKQLR